MTNNDIKQELTLIHESLCSLKTLTLKEVQAAELNPFIQMVEERFDDLHRHLISTLDTYEVSTALYSEGKEAALTLIEKRHETPEG